MALKKELIFDNGIKISYHRLGDISIDNKNKKLKVTVVSYTDETYRQKEIDNEINKNKYEELLKLIFEENQKLEEKRNVEQVIVWSNEANELIDKFKEDVILSVIETDFEFNEINDFTMSNIYNLLKETEMFENSEDV